MGKEGGGSKYEYAVRAGLTDFPSHQFRQRGKRESSGRGRRDRHKKEIVPWVGEEGGKGRLTKKRRERGRRGRGRGRGFPLHVSHPSFLPSLLPQSPSPFPSSPFLPFCSFSACCCIVWKMGKKKKEKEKGRSISNCTTWKSAAPRATYRTWEGSGREQSIHNSPWERGGEKGERKKKGGKNENRVELYQILGRTASFLYYVPYSICLFFLLSTMQCVPWLHFAGQ